MSNSMSPRENRLSPSRVAFALLATLFITVPAFPQWLQPGGGIVHYNGGKVGIGTSTPPHMLSVWGGGPGTQTYLDVTNYTTSAGWPAGLNMSSSFSNTVGTMATTPNGHYLAEWSFRGVDQNLAFRQAAIMDVFQDGASQATGVPGMFQFMTGTGSVAGPMPRMVIRASGNVGIGTTSPTSLLHVAGNALITGDVTVSGNIAAKYQDLAEWVPTSTEIEMAPGTVVVLDMERDNTVHPSLTPYDTAVAGVVSSKPGIILGEAGDNKAQIATTGRVKVKVDTSAGPIQIGDLLVTGNRPGYAMRSKPIDISGAKIHRPGTIIGKALEPLRQGSGEVLVLLSLQ